MMEENKKQNGGMQIKLSHIAIMSLIVLASGIGLGSTIVESTRTTTTTTTSVIIRTVILTQTQTVATPETEKWACEFAILLKNTSTYEGFQSNFDIELKLTNATGTYQVTCQPT
jgi:hypothetical protein